MEKLNHFYKDRPVLVTGGAGFIGSTLVHHLVKAGARVSILDNFSTGTMANLTDIAHKIKIIEGDVTDLQTCISAAQGKTHIFHLAAAISVAESHKNQKKYITINVKGTENMLKAAAAAHAQRFVFSSSAAVYGNQPEPCNELHPLAPLSPYAATKIAGEQLCAFFQEHHKLSCISLRYFNVYGPKQRIDGGYPAVIPNFTHNLLHNESLTIFGNGQQTRDFISVDEIARANMMAGALLDITHPIINVASGQSKSLLQVIDELVEHLGCAEPTLKFLPARAGDVMHSQANCERYGALKKHFESLS